MHTAHAHLGVTPGAFDRVVEHLAAALGGARRPCGDDRRRSPGKLAPLRTQIVAA